MGLVWLWPDGLNGLIHMYRILAGIVEMAGIILVHMVAEEFSEARESKSTFQYLVCTSFADVMLAKTCHIVEPESLWEENTQGCGYWEA